MSAEEPQLRVQSGGRVLGPMTIVEVANLLALGQISERDQVSENGGPWKAVEQYVLEQSGGDLSGTASDADALFDDGFSIDLPAGQARAPVEPDSYRLAEPIELDEIPKPKKPVAKRRRPADDDSEDVDDDKILDAIQALAREQHRDREPAPRPTKKPAARPVPLARGLTAGGATGPAIPAGMTPLIQGRDFTGWTFFPKDEEANADAWSIQSGILRFDGSTTRPHLLTTATFTDFELWFAWKSLKPNGRGGVFLRSDIDEDGTRDWISLSAADAGRMLGPNASGTHPVVEHQKPPGEWNLWRIVAKGDRVALWCNERPAWNTGRLTKRRGSVGLRGDGTPLEYKLLQIRALRPK